MGVRDRPTAFPPRGSTWMRDNLDWLKDYPAKDIVCLPGSHDAGMDRASWKTFHVTEGNIVTQTGSIGEQLRCGVRWFDIRPYAKENEWFCGHATSTQVGWQGGTGEKIDDVIADVNSFTANNKELIVLRLTHLCVAETGSPLSQNQDTDILRMFLGGLTNIRKSNTTSEDLLDQTIDKYVGKDECVLVVTRAPSAEGNQINDGAWDKLGRKMTEYSPYLESLCFMQDDMAAVMTGSVARILLPAASFFADRTMSILGATEGLQNSAFPTLPQALVVQTGGTNLTTRGVVLQVDNNRDDAAMTMCLAASRAQWLTKKNAALGAQCIVVYGGQLITDRNTVSSIAGLIAARKKIKVQNSLFGGLDTWPGSRKACCVYYSEVRGPNTGDGLFWKGRFAREGDELDFASDIEEVYWHNKYLKGVDFRQAYGYFIAGLVSRVPIRLDIGTMEFLQPDPAVGTRKHVELDYWSLNCLTHKERNIYEGRKYDLGRDIDWIKYDSWLVDDPNVYRQFFDRIDAESTAGIMVSNGVFGRDPAPGKRKEARMSCRKGPGTDREDYQMEGKWWNVSDIL